MLGKDGLRLVGDVAVEVPAEYSGILTVLARQPCNSLTPSHSWVVRLIPRYGISQVKGGNSRVGAIYRKLLYAYDYLLAVTVST